MPGNLSRALALCALAMGGAASHGSPPAPAHAERPGAPASGPAASDSKDLPSRLSALHGRRLARLDIAMEAQMECGVDAKPATPTPPAELARAAAQGKGEPARFKAQMECLLGFKSRLPGRVQAQTVEPWVDKAAFESAYQAGLKAPADQSLGWASLALKVDSYWQIASMEAKYPQGAAQAVAKAPRVEASLWSAVGRARQDLAHAKAAASSASDPALRAAAARLADAVGSDAFQAMQALYLARNVAPAESAARAADRGDRKPLEAFGAGMDKWMRERIASKLRP